MRCAVLVTTFAHCETVEEIVDDPQELAEDAEEHDCINPAGHSFATSCGKTKCVHCCLVVWS